MPEGNVTDVAGVLLGCLVLVLGSIIVLLIISAVAFFTGVRHV
jgi:hypothetical protein